MNADEDPVPAAGEPGEAGRLMSDCVGISWLAMMQSFAARGLAGGDI